MCRPPSSSHVYVVKSHKASFLSAATSPTHVTALSVRAGARAGGSRVHEVHLITELPPRQRAPLSPPSGAEGEGPSQAVLSSHTRRRRSPSTTRGCPPLLPVLVAECPHAQEREVSGVSSAALDTRAFEAATLSVTMLSPPCASQGHRRGAPSVKPGASTAVRLRPGVPACKEQRPLQGVPDAPRSRQHVGWRELRQRQETALDSGSRFAPISWATARAPPATSRPTEQPAGR